MRREDILLASLTGPSVNASTAAPLATFYKTRLLHNTERGRRRAGQSMEAQ